MPEAQIDQMGLQAFDNLKKQKPISNNSKYNQVATCIAGAITRETGGNWEVVVFEDASPNAFALPGNKIGIHTGMLALVDNQDQLAAVIGHEIGHVLARHSNERASQEFAVSQGLGIIQAVSAPQTALGQTALGMLGIGAQYGILMPYSRVHESEADMIGVDLMAKAGFDPRQSIGLWQTEPVSIFLWVLCEIAIAACDLAEVIGSAIALNLLFGIPLPWGIAITALDVLLVLYLQNKGFRLLEALVIALIATIGGCFLFEIIISRPDLGGRAGFIPSGAIVANPQMLYIAIGILGATVMPHNLYLHSSIVQTRQVRGDRARASARRCGSRSSTRRSRSSFALFINAAILIVAAATFHTHGQHARWPRSRTRTSC